MSTAINPTGTPNDPRIGVDQTPSKGTRHRSDSETANQDADAAKVTISDQAAAVSESLRLAQSENLAAASGSVADISRASEMVKGLAGQISAQPGALGTAHRISPRSALNLLG
jgi:hypothetical protein